MMSKTVQIIRANKAYAVDVLSVRLTAASVQIQRIR